MRIAAIDIGSNSIHMIVAEADVEGGITTLWRMKEMVGLGREAFASRAIPREAMKRAIQLQVEITRLCAMTMATGLPPAGSGHHSVVSSSASRSHQMFCGGRPRASSAPARCEVSTSSYDFAIRTSSRISRRSAARRALHSPCFTAFIRDFALPAVVRGPGRPRNRS
jgi:hypothetical protein